MSWISKLQPLNFLRDIFVGWIEGGQLTAKAAETDLVKAVLASLTATEKAQGVADIDALKHVVEIVRTAVPSDPALITVDAIITELEGLLAADPNALPALLGASIAAPVTKAAGALEQAPATAGPNAGLGEPANFS
jgi:hypothetical protein